MLDYFNDFGLETMHSFSRWLDLWIFKTDIRLKKFDSLFGCPSTCTLGILDPQMDPYE